nr:peptidoglycan-recognition protein LB-like isoform X2 [Leptinotarsa decemlineata]
MTFRQTFNILICCVMCVVLNIVALVSSSMDPVIVSRSDWHAKPPKSIEVMANPVPYVVIHHSYLPPACFTTEECIKAMQWMQDLHQINNSWADIGYHFAVGGDGKAYEGRGWSRVGAHAPNYNSISIGICIIGDWRERLPPESQLTAVHQLIEMGVREGKIAEDYKLVGHKQVRDGTACPGEKLYSSIQSWPHFYKVPNPPPPRAQPAVITLKEDNRLKKRTALTGII